MTIRIAVNGPGRIGRSIVRAIYEENFNDVELIAINSSAPLETLAHLLRYDSVHGRFNYAVEIKNQKLFVNNKEVIVCNQRDPKKLPWKEMNIDLVFECTGAFTSLEDATMHIESGAKKVIISAPAKEPNVKTIIYGVNDNTLTSQDSVISIGSCTTNCLAPIAKILNDTIGIQKGFMTTIHAYTNDQNIVDNTHKDLRRARACAMSMIPTSTGAAKAIGLVLPELNGKLDGVAIRVPTPNVSMVDLNFIANKNTSTSEVNSIIRDAINGNMSRALQYVDEPLVSIDFNHNSFSSCFDATQTKVIGDNLVKVCSWYDNEWAFSVRMLDVARLMIK
jgi:glyceraldehyde 3-phosphate dehydrogenase